MGLLLYIPGDDDRLRHWRIRVRPGLFLLHHDLGSQHDVIADDQIVSAGLDHDTGITSPEMVFTEPYVPGLAAEDNAIGCFKHLTVAQHDVVAGMITGRGVQDARGLTTVAPDWSPPIVETSRTA